MKNRYDNVFWGLLMILGAGLVLAWQQGWVSRDSPETLMLVFAGLALLFFIRYLLAGLRSWGWLFPVCILLALAGTLWLATNGYEGSWIGAPLLGGIALPFLVAFGLDFRKNWWALIPALALIMSGLAAVFADTVSGEIIGAAYMFAIAIPFLVVYFVNRKNWWALIPGFILFAMGIVVLLSRFFGEWVGAFVVIAISLPFFFVYFRNQLRWWALIPAGIMASIGLNVLLSMPALGSFAISSIPSGIMFLGWAATFGWLWHQRSKVQTAWAQWPALVCLIVAIVLTVIGSLTEFGLVAVLVLGGIALIYFGLRPRKSAQVDKSEDKQ